VLAALALGVTLFPPAVRAQPTEPPSPAETAREADADEEEEPTLRWPRGTREVGVGEAIAAPVIVGTAFTLYLAPPSPPTDGRSLTTFDRELEESLYLENDRARTAVEWIGEIGFYGTFAYRAFDDLVMAGAVRGSWDVAWQLAVIDSISLGLVGAVTWGSQALYGRQRPEYTFCEDQRGADDPRCEGGDRTNRSLISGHLGNAVAGASLTCLHHGRMRIYENQTRGKAACVTHALMAVTVGVSRAFAGSHWPTDLLAGSALGFVAGWVVPRLLHYGWDSFGFGNGQWDETASSEASSLRVAVVPNAGRRRVGLSAIGMW